MIIGSIVASYSHVRYLCRIHGWGEVRNMPSPDDYALGRFVLIDRNSEEQFWLVGIIMDSSIVNPDYANYGPRLSSGDELRVFSPDSVSERGMLVSIEVLGWISNGVPHHNVPPRAVQAWHVGSFNVH